MKSKNRRRGGVVLICMLTCSLTALSLCAMAVRLALRSAREGKQTLRLRQTDWLLNAGIRRAQVKLQDGEYQGENWEIPASVTKAESAIVHISITNYAPETGELNKTISVTVELGAAPHTLRRTHKIIVKDTKLGETVINDFSEQLF